MVRSRKHGEQARQRVAELIDSGFGAHAISSEIGISYATVRHWVRLYRRSGIVGLAPVMTSQFYPFETKRAVVRLSPKLRLVIGMLKPALAALGPAEHPTIHSDQGWQYQYPTYQQLIIAHGAKQSMSRKGNCLDNAAAESFFSHLKQEFIRRRVF